MSWFPPQKMRPKHREHHLVVQLISPSPWVQFSRFFYCQTRLVIVSLKRLIVFKRLHRIVGISDAPMLCPWKQRTSPSLTLRNTHRPRMASTWQRSHSEIFLRCVGHLLFMSMTHFFSHNLHNSDVTQIHDITCLSCLWLTAVLSNQEAGPGISRLSAAGINEAAGRRSRSSRRSERHHPSRQGRSEVLWQREKVRRSFRKPSQVFLKNLF